MNKGDIIKFAEKQFGIRIDTALPQEFYDQVMRVLPGTHPMDHFLGWGYDGRGVFGFPVPWTAKGWWIMYAIEANRTPCEDYADAWVAGLDLRGILTEDNPGKKIRSILKSAVRDGWTAGREQDERDRQESGVF